ncbi:MAG: HEAT repeat domain-containing protein [Candidatus Lokiarchaeia archaeon]
MRVGAAKTLGMIGDTRAVEPLLEIVCENEGLWDSGYRCAAAEALGKIGDARAVEPLRRVMVRGDEYLYSVRLCAARALEKLGWKPADDVERVYFLVTNNEWDKVVEMGEAAIDPLVRSLSNELSPFQIVDPDVQLNVVQALFRIGGKRVIRSLAAALKRIDNSTVYAKAEYALDRLRGGIKIREDGEDEEDWGWEDEDYVE